MSCTNTSETVTSLLDGRLNAAERAKALAHVECCVSCNAQYQAARVLRQNMQEMGRVPVPEALVARLRVVASHERERRLRRFNWAAFANHWTGRARLCFDNMMRPAFLPVAGGLVFAILMLAWLPILQVRAARPSTSDIPLPMFSTRPQSLRVKAISDSNGVVVALTIDARGRVCDYSVIKGQMTPGLANMILLSRFYPATVFGKPTSGKVIYTVSQVDVTG